MGVPRSTTMPCAIPAYADATPPSSTDRPAQRMNASVGPFSEWPPTSGLTATTGAAASASASRIPGTASIGPMLATGFEGPIRIASAARSATLTSGVMRACSAPRNSTPSSGGSECCRIRYSWKWRHSPSVRT